MFKIKIPCYFHNKSSIEYEKAIGDIPAEMCEIREVIIYTKPLFVAAYFEGDDEKGTRLIFEHNESLISSLHINKIETIIDNQL